jgi:hypothetical protein
MIEFEDRLRSELSVVAAQRPAATDLAARIDDRIQRRVRRARAQRVASVAVILTFALGMAAVALLGPADGGGVTSLADATPRTGAPGWTTIPDAPIAARFQHTAVNLDGEVLVFGGYRDETGAPGAAIYDPETGRWRPAADPPGDMGSSVAVWTGSVVLALDADGALYSYDPGRDHWAERARSPFTTSGNAVTSVVWTGEVMLGVQRFGGGAPAVSAARPVSYDPADDTWTEYDDDTVALAPFGDAVWTGDELLSVGASPGSGRSHPALELRAFSPEAGWSEIPTPPLVQPSARTLGYAVWTGGELVVGGGMTWSDEAVQLTADLVEEDREPTAEEARLLEPVAAVDAAAWNPETRTWRRLPDAPVPSTGLDRYAEPWTGSEVVTWEMDPADLGTLTGRLVLLDPTTGGWRISAPSPVGYQQEAPATWTGHELVIFSGEPTTSDPAPGDCCGGSFASGVSFVP